MDRRIEWRDIETMQDEVTFRRAILWELQRLSSDVQELREQPPPQTPWWSTILFSVLIAGAIGYIGIVHQAALSNRAVVSEVKAEQDRRSNIRADVLDLKQRISANEALAGQIPYIARQLQDIANKLDRLIEGPRGQRP